MNTAYSSPTTLSTIESSSFPIFPQQKQDFTNLNTFNLEFEDDRNLEPLSPYNDENLNFLSLPNEYENSPLSQDELSAEKITKSPPNLFDVSKAIEKPNQNTQEQIFDEIHRPASPCQHPIYTYSNNRGCMCPSCNFQMHHQPHFPYPICNCNNCSLRKKHRPMDYRYHYCMPCSPMCHPMMYDRMSEEFSMLSSPQRRKRSRVDDYLEPPIMKKRLIYYPYSPKINESSLDSDSSCELHRVSSSSTVSSKSSKSSSYNSSDKRNIAKAILRSMLSYIKAKWESSLKNNLLKSGMSEEKISQLYKEFKEIDEKEKRTHECKHYKRILVGLGKYGSFRLILIESLEAKIEEFKKDNYGKISDKNRYIYKMGFEDFLEKMKKMQKNE